LLLPQGKQDVPQDPCLGAANAPSPQQYAAQGATLRQQTAQLALLPPQFGGIAATNALGTLLNFARGRSLDAQVLYGGSQAYGNYAYGVLLAAAGLPLPDALSAANAYGAARSTYSASQLAGSEATGYPSIPPANVDNITNGYNAQQNGTLCTKPQ
jgi:hypothetical protein